MNRFRGLGLLLMAVLLAMPKLYQRLQDERQDRHYQIYSDWTEVKAASARHAYADLDLMRMLKSSGVTGLLVAPSLVGDYSHRGWPTSAEDLRVIRQQLLYRSFQQKPGITTAREWELLQDADLGFDPRLLRDAKVAGLTLLLRVEQQPVLSARNALLELDAIADAHPGLAILFSSDQLPGGPDALAEWSNWVRRREIRIPYFEFRPAKAARQLAARQPHLVRRAHTIPQSELKEMPPEVERARWLRAVRDRSCRYLLMHMSPEDSLPDYRAGVEELVSELARDKALPALPDIMKRWMTPQRGALVRSMLCLFIAILIPAVALRWGMQDRVWMSFFSIVAITVLAASVMAALADTPLTRLSLVPFRGIKLAILLGWASCFMILFSRQEVQRFLAEPLRRFDLVLLAIAGVILLYMVLRTGNAGANWKSGWETGLRHHLEAWLVARPRFKEFAVGYPLLLLGLSNRTTVWGRFMIGLGMIGPISVVNTFCHLHSPLYLAYWRTLNGVVLGAMAGGALLVLSSWRRLR